MPFTLSHPAAVVPLRRLRLPIAALAIGSMVPDVPLFLPGWTYGFSHSPTGLLTVDLATGLIVTAVWWTLLRAPFVDALPNWFRHRMPAAPRGAGVWLFAAPAVLVGSVTHVAWDAFTHEGRWGERHLPWLAGHYFGVGGVHWAQAASSVGGLAVVMFSMAATLRRAREVPRPARVERFGVTATVCVVLTGAAAAGAAVVSAGGGLHDSAFAAITEGLPAAIAAAVLAALAWWAVRART